MATQQNLAEKMEDKTALGLEEKKKGERPNFFRLHTKRHLPLLIFLWGGGGPYMSKDAGCSQSALCKI